MKIPKKDTILKFLQKSKKPFSCRQLAKAFDISDIKSRQVLGKRLKAMLKDSQITKSCGRRYSAIDNRGSIEGRVVAHPNGYGFVIPDDGGKDLFLPDREMKTVLHGDRVLAKKVNIDRKGRLEGILVSVLERANFKIVGRYYKKGNTGFLEPINKRINQHILIPENKENNAKNNQIVIAEIINQPEKEQLITGNIVDIIGDYGFGLDIIINMVIRDYEVPYEFPDEIKEELINIDKVVSNKQDKQRVDLRDIPFVTIDGEDSKDFDDAVFCEKNSKGWRLLVAIADVSNYVKKDSVLDETARLRGTSVYFPEHVLPMLPDLLSNDLCSLKPKVDRLCLVCELIISSKGKVLKANFLKAIIKSAAALTYTEMSMIVVEKKTEVIKKHLKLIPHLNNLYELYKILHAKRKNKGLIDFSSVESKFTFDEKKNVKSIYELPRNDAHRLVEEMMLVANIAAANFMAENNILGLYRIHDIPKQEKLEKVVDLLSMLGISIWDKEKPETKDYAKLIEETKKREDYFMLELILLRSMSLAIYSVENKGHFGLGFSSYSHFTSPIRRYPDLMIHRAIKHIIEGGDSSVFPYSKDFMLELAEHCSMTERRAEEASREVNKRLKCIYMKGKIGNIFSATISSVTSFGLFVTLNDVYVEGLIHINNLPVDNYQFDEVMNTLNGKRTGVKYKIGNKLTVMVLRVDVDDCKIDFKVIEK